MKCDTELSSWFIVQLQNEKDEIISEIIWGIVFHDNRNKFPQGNYICTSEITQKFNDEYIKTLNSIYKLQKNSGETIKLPSTFFTILALRNGYSPLLIKNVLSNESIH